MNREALRRMYGEVESASFRIRSLENFHNVLAEPQARGGEGGLVVVAVLVRINNFSTGVQQLPNHLRGGRSVRPG